MYLYVTSKVCPCKVLQITTFVLSYNYVELEVTFLPEIFPFYPPSVRLVRPRIENFVFARIGKN